MFDHYDKCIENFRILESCFQICNIVGMYAGLVAIRNGRIENARSLLGMNVERIEILKRVNILLK